MPEPIIFFHSSFDPYLAFTVWQARRSNPDAPVWLIGDDANNLSELGVRHFRFADHSARRDEFVKIYRHFSGHQLENERLCFERWFYLESVLAQTDTPSFHFMDSDYFLLCEVAKMSPGWAGYDLARAPVWGYAWFADRDIIHEFCDYMLDRFCDPQQLAEWAHRFKAGEDFSSPEGIYNVCDMTLWRMFIRARNKRHLDLSIPRDGVVFDEGLGHDGAFQMRDGFKIMSRNGDGYYCHPKNGALPVRFAALHLNGKYPKRIQPLFTGWPWPVLRACWRPNYRRNLRKLMLIISYSLRVKSRLIAPAQLSGKPGL